MEMRPDTPESEPYVIMADQDAMSVEELDTQLHKTTCQESLHEKMCEIACLEERESEVAVPTFYDNNNGNNGNSDNTTSCLPCSQLPIPLPAKFNKYGTQTTQSKGKG
ncbi:hypothetical protein FRC07_012257 [Ceratobasidium sp. 392]|nr:hypothetical protein FRC07_012257 [Ceratobasidium sp. 392]